jgi:AAA domain
MTPFPFQYDALHHVASATWEDCLLRATHIRRDAKGVLRMDLRATTPDGTLLHRDEDFPILKHWEQKAFAEMCDATPEGQLKMQQYLALFGDFMSEELATRAQEAPAAPVDAAQPYAILIRGSDIRPEALSYLWPPYIPRKMATILDGDPGTGKTGLACVLVAAITRGWPMPDQEGRPTVRPPGPGPVLMVAMEDNLGAVIQPRLERLHANLD